MTLQKGRLHQQYYRNGENHRGGADVTFLDVLKVFGFRSVEVGKWVTKEEQHIAANLFFDALSDLMDILQVPKQVISLNGTLSISFGKGGRKYACAHYNSAKRQLGLAKNAGGGALAHEWFHAFDHYICTKLYALKQAHLFASEAWLNDLAKLNEHPLNMLLEESFRQMFMSEQGASPSLLMQASIAVDKQQKIFYYARPQELAARAFERMIQASSIKNAFLVQGSVQSKEAQQGLYPNEQEMRRYQAPLLRYFSQLGRALISK